MKRTCTVATTADEENVCDTSTVHSAARRIYPKRPFGTCKMGQLQATRWLRVASPIKTRTVGTLRPMLPMTAFDFRQSLRAVP